MRTPMVDQRIWVREAVSHRLTSCNSDDSRDGNFSAAMCLSQFCLALNSAGHNVRLLFRRFRRRGLEFSVCSVMFGHFQSQVVEESTALACDEALAERQ